MSKENQERELIKRGRYALTNPETGRPATFQRVTKFNKSLDDQEGLIDWSNRFVAKGMSLEEADHLLVRAASCSIDDRGELNRIAKEAKKLAGGDQAADDGTTLHALTEAIDRGENPRIPAKWRGHMERYRDLVDNGPLEVLPDYIERVVCVPELGVAGTFDRLMRVTRNTTVAFPSGKTAELREGELVVVDVKSSKQLELSQVSFSVQFAVYSRAKHVWNVEEEDWDSLPDNINQDVAFILWIPSTKSNGELVAVDIDAGWEAALECKRVQEIRRSKKLIQSVYSVTPEDDPDTYAARIKRASSREELSEIWKDANSMRMWTPELRTLGENRAKELGS